MSPTNTAQITHPPETETICVIPVSRGFSGPNHSVTRGQLGNFPPLFFAQSYTLKHYVIEKSAAAPLCLTNRGGFCWRGLRSSKPEVGAPQGSKRGEGASGHSCPKVSVSGNVVKKEGLIKCQDLMYLGDELSEDALPGTAS